MTPIELVERQLDAYNARNIERFVANYSPDVQVFRMPAVAPAIDGMAAFRAFYATQRFNLPGLHAHIVNRIVMGNKVVDHERIDGIGPEPVEIAVVYEIVDGLIRTMWAYAPR